MSFMELWRPTTKCSIDLMINGDDNLVKNEMKYDILSLDLSSDEEGKSTTWKTLGLEVFEIVVLTCLTLSAIYWIGKMTFNIKGWVGYLGGKKTDEREKRRNSKS